MGPNDFHIVFPSILKSMGPIKCLVTHFLLNIDFCVQQNKEMYTGLEQLEGE